MTGFATRLHQQIQQKQTPALIGIDPRWDWLPAEIRQAAETPGGRHEEIVARGFERFSCEILELAAEHVAVVKPQVAFFEQYGVPGLQALQNVMRKARSLGLIVIADAKRGDIGTTA
ncbi:MAG: orotidine-5'-phosphate decarboxylase, partial [Planctomycetaceae bacterium]